MSKVIGEGTYGCVHKPSLKCTNENEINKKNKTPLSYDNKVSKILTKLAAKKEIAEYKKVSKADKKDEFYLGKPKSCHLDITDPSNLEAIEKCRIGADALKNLESYDLIVMGDGGDNLETHTQKMREWSKSEMSTENCEKFLLEVLRLFAGLKRFAENDLIHYDLKPQNIVYNERTNRLNFIDFGLMQSKTKTIKKCNQSKHNWAFFHWSYPWEIELLNKRDFEYVKQLPERQYNAINRDLNKKDGYYYNHILNFAYYSFDSSDKVEYNTTFTDYLRNYQTTVTDDTIMLKYEDFLEKSVSTIDLFGVGMALNHWLSVAKKHLDERHNNYLSYFFKGLISSRLLGRDTVDSALETYEQFLINSRLLEKYEKEIKNHIVVDKELFPSPSPEPKVNVLKLDKKFRPDPEFVNADPVPCPEGKTRNPTTGRCVKNKTHKVVDCPEGKTRNPTTGRCVKNKTAKAVECPDSKEINQKTGRCVKKCRDGYNRNDDFVCVSKKMV